MGFDSIHESLDFGGMYLIHQIPQIQWLLKENILFSNLFLVHCKQEKVLRAESKDECSTFSVISLYNFAPW